MPEEILEKFVVEQTMNCILTPEQIESIASAVVKEYKKEFSDEKVSEYQAALSRVEKELDKLVDALVDSPKVAHQKIYDRMESLGLQKSDLEDCIKKLSVASKISLSETEVSAWMWQFKDGDPSDIDFQRRIIDLFVNCVYVYHDRVVIFYNIRGGGKNVQYTDIKTAPDTKSEAVSGCSLLNTLACADGTKNEHWYVFVSGVLGLVIPITGGRVGK